jgi:hypothetical protein
MHQNTTNKILRATVARLYRTTSRGLRLAAGAVGIAFVLGYAGSPVMAQEAIGTVASEALSEELSSLDGLSASDYDEPTGPLVPPTAREVLLSVCRDRGYGEDCAKLLYGMVWKESRFDGLAVGDQGRAQGYFQIHYKLHGISLACAQNLKCSAAWSLRYMESNGYPSYAAQAVQCHNGCGVRNGYAAAVKSVGNRKWKEAEQTEAEIAKKREAAAKLAVKAAVVKAEAPIRNDATNDEPQAEHLQLAAMTGRELGVVALVSR